MELTEETTFFSHLRVELLNKKEEFVQCLMLFINSAGDYKKSRQAADRVFSFINAKLEDFQMMRIVGKGTFGKVFQVMHKKTQKIYAMKCIRKDVVLENEQMDSLKLEKEILYNIEHPFIVGMDYVFENNLRIFFLMDFIEGGELFRHLV